MKNRIFAVAGLLLMAAFTLAAQQQGAAQGPKPKSKGESEALMKVQAAAQANDPKAALDAISNVLENFTDTEYKPMLYTMALQAAQQTNDFPTIVIWGERVLQAEPNSIEARVVLAESTAANTHSTDLDKDQNIKKVQDYANQALALLNKPDVHFDGIPTAQTAAFKAHMLAGAHDALGQAAEVNKNYPEAIKEFQAGANADPSDTLVLARMTKAYNDAKQYDQAIATADKILAMKDCPTTDNSPCVSPQVKSYVTGQKNFASKLKGTASATPPASTTTPATK